MPRLWTTTDELNYISSLGTWSEKGVKVGRLQCLLQYQRSLRHRADWAGIEQLKMIMEVSRQIKLERAKRP